MLTRRAALALLATPALARAAHPLRIAFLTTLSGPGAQRGADLRDGFALAQSHGALGGIPVQLVIHDDAGDPARARAIIDHQILRQGLRLYTGIASPAVFNAVIGEILREGGIYANPGPAPAHLAGRDCHPNYYVLSCQDDAPYEAAGRNATLLGHRRPYLVAPDTAAGHAAIAAFKRHFPGPLAAETYTPPGPPDFAATLAHIPATGADAVFQAHTGPASLAFIRQHHRSALGLPLLVAASALGPSTLATAGEAALGIEVAAHWNADFDNVANRNFTADFHARYHRPPGQSAADAYDTALAIGAALFAVKGELRDTEVFRHAMLPAIFESVRGRFAFGPNQHPIQDWWGLRVEADRSGAPFLVTRRKIFSHHGDAYAAACRV